jgi:drug/metabolite transporter (DMT)-like permease
VAVALAASSWGLWPLILRRAERIAPLSAVLESTIVMAVMTAVSGVAMLRDRLPTRARFMEWVGVAWLGVGDALNVALFFAAYKRTIAVAVLTHYLTPVLVALGAPFVLRERIGPRGWLSIAIAFAGLAVMLAPWQGSFGPDTIVSAMLGAASALFYASNVLVNKRLSDFSTSELMFWHGVVATPLLAVMVPRDAWALATPQALGLVSAGAIGPGALAGLAFVWGLRRMPASHASTLTLLEPFVAVLVGVAALGECMTGGTAIGGVMILGGALLVLLRRPRERDEAPDAFRAGRANVDVDADGAELKGKS